VEQTVDAAELDGEAVPGRTLLVTASAAQAVEPPKN
jgi:hypothetical protein